MPWTLVFCLSHSLSHTLVGFNKLLEADEHQTSTPTGDLVPERQQEQDYIPQGLLRVLLSQTPNRTLSSHAFLYAPSLPSQWDCGAHPTLQPSRSLPIVLLHNSHQPHVAVPLSLKHSSFTAQTYWTHRHGMGALSSSHLQ